jgi:hypothetical protein
MKKLAAAITALALSLGAAQASGPSPFAGIPNDYHIGEGSCVFSINNGTGLGFSFYGVPSDGQHAAMCDAIVAAFNGGRAIGWGTFPTTLTVPCDPHFCGADTATRVSNFVGVPNPQLP